MTHDPADGLKEVSVLSPERLVDLVRRGLELKNAVPMQFSEIHEFSNINYVYHVQVPGRSLYLKVVPSRPKRFPATLPRERVFSEAEGLRRFRRLCGDRILIPEVLFVDPDDMALAMSDVGEGREVLFGVLGKRFELLGEQSEALGQALGAIHSGTRGAGTFRPAMEETIIRKIIFEGLLAPGAREVFPDNWDSLCAEMQTHNQCLIHSDLWSKNLLVKAGAPIAVVDFEGVCYGDPAFDLATLVAIAILPALEHAELVSDVMAFTARMLHAWSSSCGCQSWPAEIFPRIFRAIACFLAARGFGPFAYAMTECARWRVTKLARSLAEEPPLNVQDLQFRVESHARDAPSGPFSTTSSARPSGVT